jgi:hypothetical protein
MALIFLANHETPVASLSIAVTVQRFNRLITAVSLLLVASVVVSASGRLVVW